jgi:hypothetical protein
MRHTTWTNGKRTVKGCWNYYWASDCFVVTLFQRDRTTGASEKTFRVYGDTPEWGNWKMQKENAP